MSPIVAARKIAEIRRRVDRVRQLLPTTVDTFRAQRTEAEALILNLYLALQACSDLAMHVIADRGLGVPGDARAAFDMLAGRGLLDAELTSALSAAVGLRNRIAHQYGTLDLDLVYVAARDDLEDLERFAAAMSHATGITAEDT